MITLDQVLSEQQDLERLCQPVNLHRHEKYSPNDNYGHAYLLKTYAGYPVEKSINATFPHGVYFRDKVLPKSEVKAPLPAVLNFPPITTPLWNKTAKHKKVIPFASPIHYAVRLFQAEVKKENRKGTLFLPKHSTKVVDVTFDVEAVVRELKSLPDDFKPVTVCVHWNDIEKGLHKVFIEAGFEVVTAGHLTDYNYMFRWLHLVSRHKLLAGCGLGSALFYSVIAGVPFYLTQEDAETKSDANIQLFNKSGPQYSSKALRRMALIKKLFGQPSEMITKEQLDLVNYYTCANLVKTPEALLKLFNSLNRLG